jgi:hypothetical protein
MLWILNLSEKQAFRRTPAEIAQYKLFKFWLILNGKEEEVFVFRIKERYFWLFPGNSVKLTENSFYTWRDSNQVGGSWHA